MEKLFKHLETWILFSIIFLVPVLVLPIFPNAYVTPKLLVLTWGLAAILIIKSIHTFMRGSLKMSLAAFDVPVIFIGLSYLIATLARTPNKMEAFLLPGTATAVLAGVLLYFVINQLTEAHKINLRVPLLLSGAFISIFSLLAISGILRSFSSLPAFMREPSFSLLEGTLPNLLFLLALLPLSIQVLIAERDTAKKAIYGVASVLIVFGSIVALFNSLPGRPTSPNLPSFQTSWYVTVDTLKESPLLGAGPGNYLTSFNRFRPVSYNETNLWPVRFNSSRSYYLTAITEVGMLGAAGFVLLILKLIQVAKLAQRNHKEEGYFSPQMSALVSFGLLGLLLIFFPATPTLLVLFFILLALATKAHKTKVDLLSTKEEEHTEETHEKQSWVGKLPVILGTAPVVILAIAFLFFSSKVIAAEYTYRKALEAIVANDGRNAYDLLRKAIVTNPYVDRYRSTYSQVNLSLANTIAGKQNITDSEKQTVSQLIQQAIREGKASVVLNQSRSANWELLSSVYRAIIPLAKGADQYAVQTMRQAVILDPVNPNLRIALGGIFYQLKAYDAAIDSFKVATAAKPDLANAHYNLAVAYREKGEIERAVAEMNAVLTLVKKDSKDYELARQELENLQKKLPAKTDQSGETLVPPTQEEDILNPKLDLPNDAQPPEPQATESPSVSPTPSPSVTPVASPSATPAI